MEKSLAEANYIRLSDKLWDREMNEGNHEESHLLTSNVDGIFTMTMNRPGKKNGLNFKMFRELILALDEATVDSSVRVVVWTGSGEWYSTGLDFTTLGVLANDPDRMDGWLDRSMANEFIDRLVCFPKPLVAAVNGPVRGIATTTLALCDLVYASEKADFQLPFPELGVSTEGCSSYLFHQILGPAKANELMLRGRTISAAEADAWGLISDVIPHSQFTEEVEKRVKHLSTLPPLGLQVTKKVSRAPLTEILFHANKREVEGLSITLATGPMMEIGRRFAKKK
jgi:peroxisomal 3,2-trans-enoyl-CoA isomerase